MSIKCSLEKAGYRDGGNNLDLSGQTIFSMINNKNVQGKDSTNFVPLGNRTIEKIVLSGD